MKSEKFAVSMLSVSAMILFLACVFINKPASAEVSVKDRDYMMCTYPATGASDALYIVDSRNGVFGVFMWDNGTRSLQPIAVRPMADAFGARR
jgi:hypothetical protein